MHQIHSNMNKNAEVSIMTYKCMKCKKDFEMEDRVRCPFCGFRVISKTRPVFRKRIIAR